mgnify:CR=1 FL=1
MPPEAAAFVPSTQEELASTTSLDWQSFAPLRGETVETALLVHQAALALDAIARVPLGPGAIDSVPSRPLETVYLDRVRAVEP